MVGWASHLYYWVYPGLMVGVTALVVGYMLGQLFPDTFNAAVPSPLFMILFCVVFAFGVAYIAFRGVRARRRVNAAINVIQITALIVFSVMAIGYRVNHPEGSRDGRSIRTATPITRSRCRPTRRRAAGQGRTGQLRCRRRTPTAPTSRSSSTYAADSAMTTTLDPTIRRRRSTPFQYHASAASVVAPHNFNYMFIQACIAILILVGFESVTSMGEEAKNAKRDIPRAVILSLLIQGVFCYLIEYFAANYFLHNGYQIIERARLGGADRRHDDHRRHLAVRQPRGREGVHARPGASPSSWR